MALITCPDCHENISDQALACLRCGHPIAAHALASATRRRKLVLAVGGLGTLVLGVALFVSDDRVRAARMPLFVIGGAVYAVGVGLAAAARVVTWWQTSPHESRVVRPREIQRTWRIVAVVTGLALAFIGGGGALLLVRARRQFVESIARGQVAQAADQEHLRQIYKRIATSMAREVESFEKNLRSESPNKRRGDCRDGLGFIAYWQTQLTEMRDNAGITSPLWSRIEADVQSLRGASLSLQLCVGGVDDLSGLTASSAELTSRALQ